MMMDRDYPKTASGILVQQTADAVVLLDSRGGDYFALDEVGGRIWALCDGMRSRAEITRVLCTEYEVESQVMAADLDELLAGLEEARLVTFDD